MLMEKNLKKAVIKRTNRFTFMANWFIDTGKTSFIGKSEKYYFVLGTTNNIIKTPDDVNETLITKLVKEYVYDKKYQERYNAIRTIGGWKSDEKNEYYVDNGILFMYNNGWGKELNRMEQVLDLWNGLNKNPKTAQKEVYNAKLGKSHTYANFKSMYLVKKALVEYHEEEKRVDNT